MRSRKMVEVPGSVDAPWGEHNETISYREAHLNELIAASVEVAPERQSTTAIVIAPPVEFSAESTVAIASSVELAAMAAVPIESTVPLHEPRRERVSTSSIGPFVVGAPSSPPPALSYSLTTPPPPLGEPARFPLGTRIAYVISVAVFGVMCGGIAATALLPARDVGAAALRPAEPRTSVDEKIPVTSVLRSPQGPRSRSEGEEIGKGAIVYAPPDAQR